MWLGIQVVFGLPQQCTDLNFIGCYYPGEKVIYVTDKPTNVTKASIIYHEIGHFCGYNSEKTAREFSDFWVTGKSKRKEEFINMTAICKKIVQKGVLPNSRK